MGWVNALIPKNRLLDVRFISDKFSWLEGNHSFTLSKWEQKWHLNKQWKYRANLLHSDDIVWRQFFKDWSDRHRLKTRMGDHSGSWGKCLRMRQCCYLKTPQNVSRKFRVSVKEGGRCCCSSKKESLFRFTEIHIWHWNAVIYPLSCCRCDGYFSCEVINNRLLSVGGSERTLFSWTGFGRESRERWWRFVEERCKKGGIQVFVAEKESKKGMSDVIGTKCCPRGVLRDWNEKRIMCTVGLEPHSCHWGLEHWWWDIMESVWDHSGNSVVTKNPRRSRPQEENRAWYTLKKDRDKQTIHTCLVSLSGIAKLKLVDFYWR